MKHLLRTAFCLALLCILLSSVSPNVGHGWDDFEWYGAHSSCNPVYTAELLDCRNESGYPLEPDEGACKTRAGTSLIICNGQVPSPAYSPEFCTLANYANQNCIAQYGPGSGNQDLGALLTCRNASRIDECQ